MRNEIQIRDFLIHPIEIGNVHIFQHTLVVVLYSQIRLLLHFECRVRPLVIHVMAECSNKSHEEFKTGKHILEAWGQFAALVEHEEHRKGMAEVVVGHDVVP